MTPEEHLRRMRHDEVWNLQAPPRTTPLRSGTVGAPSGRRTQIWTTAVVAAAVVAVAGVAIAVAPVRGGTPAGPGAAPATEPSTSVSASDQPSTPSTPTPSTTPAAPSLVHQTESAVPLQITPSASPVAAEPSTAVQVATTHGDRPALEFVAADRADVARGQRAVACLQGKGVRFVDLAAPDAEGIRYLEFGGPGNDQQSISLGLQYSDTCIARAAR